MQDRLNEIIQGIHASHAKGIFTEIGAGQPISAALFGVDGASDTIVAAESPYQKEEQDKLFPSAKGMRHVCAERVHEMLSVNETRYPDANLWIATSFTLSNNRCSHGYIGIRFKLSRFHTIHRIYHMTFPSGMSRQERIDRIGHVGVCLLALIVRMAQYPIRRIHVPPFLNFIDDVQSPSDAFTDELIDLYYMHAQAAQSNPDGNEHAVLFMPNGSTPRFETLCREAPKQPLLIFKGSFAILHNMHVAMADEVQTKTGGQPIFTISLSTYQKGDIERNDLKHRINMILQAGYPVMLLQSPWFENNFKYLHSRQPQKEIHFIVGSDTLERLLGRQTESGLTDQLLIPEAARLLPGRHAERPWLTDPKLTFAWFARGDDETLQKYGEIRIQRYSLRQDVASSDLMKTIQIADFDAEFKNSVPKHVYQFHLVNRHKPQRIPINDTP